MRKINWKVRLSNLNFWLAAVPGSIVVIQAFLEIFGIKVDLQFLSERLLNFIGVLFPLLALFGVIMDPTTKGFGDSERALGYTEPN